MWFLTAHHATGARESEEVMEVREVWRYAHLKQTLGRSGGYRTRQLGGQWPQVDHAKLSALSVRSWIEFENRYPAFSGKTPCLIG